MAFSADPKGFFGPTYVTTAGSVTLPNVDSTDVTVGTFTCDGTTSTVTVSAAHNLKVGDKVALSTAATTLPDPFDALDYFVVSVPSSTTLTLSLTKGGTAIVTTDTGTGVGDHTIKALGALQEVTNTEAATGAGGDWRKILYGICELVRSKYTNTPVADRPTNVTVSSSTSTNEATGDISRYYNIKIVTTPTGLEVADE